MNHGLHTFPPQHPANLIPPSPSSPDIHLDSYSTPQNVFLKDDPSPLEEEATDEDLKSENQVDDIIPHRRSCRLLGLGTTRQSLRLKGIHPEIAHYATDLSYPIERLHCAYANHELFGPNPSETIPYALSLLAEHTHSSRRTRF